MTLYRLVVPVVLLAGGLACAGLPGQPPPVAPAPPAPAAAPPPGFHAPGRPDISLGRGVPPSDDVAHYLADCHYVFPAVDGEGDNTDDECRYVEFEQNCAPDFSGCSDKGIQCRTDCGKPCASCQSSCGDTCETCKQACRGDAGCERICAESRAACRSTCLTAKSACTDGACGEAESACGHAWDADLARKCPDCSAITGCIQSGGGDECRKQFSADDSECFQWCLPGM